MIIKILCGERNNPGYPTEYVTFHCCECQGECVCTIGRYNRHGSRKKEFCSLQCMEKYRLRKSSIEHKCSYCNGLITQYLSSKTRRPFCSKQCYYDFRRKDRWIQLTCKQCNRIYFLKEYDYQHHHKEGCINTFCSPKCYNDFRKAEWVEITCKWCGKKKIVRKLYIDRGQYQFCSDKCRHESALKGVNRKQLIRYCIKCGKKFNVSVGEHLQGKRRIHCSKKCQQRREIVRCKTCHKYFERALNEKNKRIFCSMSCYHKFNGETSIEKAVRIFLEKQGIKFKTQVQIKRFTVDFLICSKAIAIEVDGVYWHNKSGYIKQRDRRKDEMLKSKGYKVIRIPEVDVRDGTFKDALQTYLN